MSSHKVFLCALDSAVNSLIKSEITHTQKKIFSGLGTVRKNLHWIRKAAYCNTPRMIMDS